MFQNCPIDIIDNEDNNTCLDILSFNKNVDFNIEGDFSFTIDDKDPSIEKQYTNEAKKENKENDQIKEQSKKHTNETDKPQIKNEKYHMEIKKPKKKEKIFEVKKLNKKRGRLDIDSKRKEINAPHNKSSNDNIMQKIKARFLKNLMNFLNFLYSDYIGIKNSKLIFMIDPSSSRNINRKDCLEWFDKKIKDVFSYKISLKYKKFNRNTNIIKIGNFYEKEKNNSIKLIQILEMKIRDIYEIYLKDEKEEGFEELNNFIYDKKQLENETYQNNEANLSEYLEKYVDFAKNLEQKFKNKAKRNYNKNKKNPSSFLENKK